MDKNIYCANCKRISIIVLDKDNIVCEEKNSECEERIFEDELNEDCVRSFLTNDDDDDDDADTNRITATSTMVSIACTAHCNNLPSYSCNVPQYVINRSDEDLTMPQLTFLPIKQLETIIMNSSRSIISKMSDSSIAESVSNYRDIFMMKENNYDNSNGNLRALKNISEVVSEEEIKEISLFWKNSTMISFSTWGKKVLHGF